MIVISQAWEFIPKASAAAGAGGAAAGGAGGGGVEDASLISGPHGAHFRLNQKSLYGKQSAGRPYDRRKAVEEATNISLNELSFAGYYISKSPVTSANNIQYDSSNEKWHLRQINEYCDKEIYIKDNKVILSYGSDNDSKVINRSYTFDAPIFDCNWFNFRTDTNDFGIIRDALCIFETQKLHVYFQNGSDFHIQLPFKLKRFWKLRDAILFERLPEYSCGSSFTRLSCDNNQIFYSLSNPLDELKPILFKSMNVEDKGTFLKENSKQVIVDVIDSLNLVLVFNVLNNTHYIYRISEKVWEDTAVVNNLLSTTINPAQTTQIEHEPVLINKNLAHLNTPMTKADSGSCLSMSINQSARKKRLSVSPIISTLSFYNKLNLVNSPSVNRTGSNQQQNASFLAVSNAASAGPSSNAQLASASSGPAINPAHQHFFQRTFSPMAALSRSPSSSSSPAIMGGFRRSSINPAGSAVSAVNSGSNLNTTLTNASTSRFATSSNTNLQVNTNPPSFMTPLLEVNNHPMGSSNQFKTPMSIMNQQNTPTNFCRRICTPQFTLNSSNSTTTNNNNNLNNTTIINLADNQNMNTDIYEQKQPEYCFELIWSEPITFSNSNVTTMNAGSDGLPLPATTASSSSLFSSEKAVKFFYVVDLYNQKYVCYLLPNKMQLRCVRVEYNSETQMSFIPMGANCSFIPAKDAIFVDNRNLMVIIDNLGSLFVYSGITKLCKLQLHNVSWSSSLSSISNVLVSKPLINELNEHNSPLVTPIKTQLFQNNVNSAKIPAAASGAVSSNAVAQLSFAGEESVTSRKPVVQPQAPIGSLFKTPKQASSYEPTTNLLPQQSYKALVDSTGSRFSIRTSDDRLIRVNLSESSTCKLVNMCLEAFKYALSREVYYELIQQWYIHRFSIGESIRDQLNLFLYLLLNLCGCFDMAKLEQELAFLSTGTNSSFSKLKQQFKAADTNANIGKSNMDVCESTPGNKLLNQHKKFESMIQEEDMNTDLDNLAGCPASVTAKRAKCNHEGNDQDWEYLLNDDFVAKMAHSQKNLGEFSYLSADRQPAKPNTFQPKFQLEKSFAPETPHQSAPTMNILSNVGTPTSLKSGYNSGAVNENIKSANAQVFRPKRSQAVSSLASGGPQSQLLPSSTAGLPQGFGILWPYLKQILYVLHLIYEECKLYRSLEIYAESLIQVQYLFAHELNLQHYLNYYEYEFPHLVRLKSLKQTGSSAQPAPSGKSATSQHISHLISQEPPVLYKFLLKLIENSKPGDAFEPAEIVSPFPIIATVTKRTIKAIKIYALISLCTRPQLRNANYNEFMNQLFFKVNFSGFQQEVINNAADQGAQQANHSFQNFFNVFSNYCTLTFTFKPGQQYIYENIFSLCLEMGMCTLNELYDYPFSILFPILEAIHWSRENPCLEWPSYAFDLIGRNDLAILKSNSDEIAAQLAAQRAVSASSEASTCDVEAMEEEAMKTPSKQQQQQQQAAVGNKYLNMQPLNIFSFGQKRYSQARRGDEMASGVESNQVDSDNSSNLIFSSTQNVKKDEEDGMQHMSQLETLKCRFNEDLRIKEVRSCLQTTRPIQIKLTQGPDVSDHDFLEEEEKFLSCICVRTMSLPVGRGIFSLHTVNPIPTEPTLIPELNLKGKSVTKKTTIDLTRIEVPSNMTYWPSFHNGVAAGLTIHAQAKDLSNAWIKSHLAKNFELTNEQAGFLYGLGLTGHLSNFSMLNIHDALTRRHDLTNIAILLGLASSKMGSMDLSVTRLISMHIKALMPPVEIELEIPYNIQIAALLSLGLVYVKSANKHFSYVLLKEIGRLPGNEIDKDVHSLDREAYSLTAGFALGLILLEKGKKSLTIMDSTFTDELYHYMVGGHKEKFYDGSGYSNQVSGGMYGSSANNANIGPNGANNDNFTNSASNSNNFRNNQSSYIREGESINTNVTCPGATIALGLIYFNSCDKLISDWFSPPDSAFLLDSIRPDFLLLRTVARNLIMWKYILPNQKWLISQLPSLLKGILRTDATLSQKFAQLLQNEPKPNTNTSSKAGSKKSKPASFMKSRSVKTSKNKRSTAIFSANEINIDADDDDDEFDDDTDDEGNVIVKKDSSAKKGSKSVKFDEDSLTNEGSKSGTKERRKHALSDLIDFDDVDDIDLVNIDEEDLKDYEEDEEAANNADVDEEADEDEDANSESSSQQSNNVIDDETKLEAFRHIIAGACMNIGLKFAGSFNNDAYETLLYWAKYFTNLNDTKLSTENCLCVILLSLAMVMAGSGDLEILRICRYLRSRVGPNITHVLYGSQMAINMALGLLFMGGGRYTLKTDSLSVALMMCAFYPHFPVDSNDNRFHLQAFRHLYVLASESRLLLSKDVDSGEFCYVPIEITLKANEHHDDYTYQEMAPCILPELNQIKMLKILGPRYYPIVFKDTLHFDDLKNILNSELVIKQKNGYFSYSDDPKDEKAYNIRNFLNKIIVPHKITPDLLEQITNEEYINTFAKMLNKSNENRLNSKTNRLLKIIYESVVQETFDFVGIMLLLDKEANKEPSSSFIQQMKLVEHFYKSLTANTHHIISKEFLHSTVNLIESKLRTKLKKQHSAIIKAYLNDECVEGVANLIHYCILNDINKHELQYYSSCTSLSEMLKAPKNSSIRPDRVLQLYQIFKSSN